MRIPIKQTVVAALAALGLLSSGCYVRTYPATRVVTTTTTSCDPRFPCSNTYYWDEWRACYVFYDGYRYYDALGTPGTYPLPPQNIVISYPPSSYVPPSYYVPPRNTYAPPPRYQAAPPNYHTAIPVTWQSAPPSRGGNYGNVPPPPPNNNGYGNVPPPPNTGGYRPPPPPSGNGNYVPPPPPSSGGYVPPPTTGGGYRPPPPTGNTGGYVPPPPPPPFYGHGR